MEQNDINVSYFLENEVNRLSGALSLIGAFLEQIANTKQNEDFKDEILGVKKAFYGLMLSSIDELLGIAELAKKQGN